VFLYFVQIKMTQKSCNIENKVEVSSANVMVTNYCNQNCSFCFANDLMKDKTIGSEMSLKDYKSVINKIKENDENTRIIKLFGGEPTLHSQFDKIVQYALRFFPQVHIYTNGIFSEKADKHLQNYFKTKTPRISFCFNITTPGFQNNEKIRKLVSGRIMKYKKVTSVTLSITIDPDFNIENFVKKINKNIFDKKTLIRIGASNPIAKRKNHYSTNQFSKMGATVVTLVKKLHAINHDLGFFLDCGFVRCMFNKKQEKFLINTGLRPAKGCYYGNIDYLANMEAIPCYSLSTMYKLSLKRQNIHDVIIKFALKEYLYGKKYMLDQCKRCKYFGYEKGQCSGPCLALLVNNRPKIQ